MCTEAPEDELGVSLTNLRDICCTSMSKMSSGSLLLKLPPLAAPIACRLLGKRVALLDSP